MIPQNAAIAPRIFQRYDYINGDHFTLIGHNYSRLSTEDRRARRHGSTRPYHNLNQFNSLICGLCSN
ncbi:hypothetical protein GE061_004152 [Apolygus lucorum]|uniref:Uncharacterized protein n=1 Tax=Apolygus lucorum TaxID=248454 RepID=A0A8S9WYG8_APOLU|nr:hypothetical protein GE061_004152 [Apolygus lucorum]